MRNGDVILVRGTSLFARLIKKHTRSPYSHAALIVDIGGSPWVVESMEGAGVRAIPWANYVIICRREGSRIDLYDPGKDDRERELATDYALLRVGDRYAPFWQFAVSFGRFHQMLYHWLKRKPYQVDPHRVFCSEFVATCYGMPEPWSWSPACLAGEFKYVEGLL